MSELHVYYRRGSWLLKNSMGIVSSHRTQQVAIERAHKFMRNLRIKLVVHDRQGKVIAVYATSDRKSKSKLPV